MNKVPRWVFRYVGNKTFDFSSKKKDFLPKNDQIWPKTGIFGQFGPGHAGLFSALLVGRLVVVVRGLYLARHLFSLCILFTFIDPGRIEEIWDLQVNTIVSQPQDYCGLRIWQTVENADYSVYLEVMVTPAMTRTCLTQRSLIARSTKSNWKETSKVFLFRTWRCGSVVQKRWERNGPVGVLGEYFAESFYFTVDLLQHATF